MQLYPSINWRRVAAVILCGTLLLSACTSAAGAPASTQTAAPTAAAPLTVTPTAEAATRPIPILAYYYIWFDPSSWDKNKIDYPLLGK